MYYLDTLIKTFEENAILCAQENETALKKYQQENPNEPIPEWFMRDFCINTALAAMCHEIDKLRISVGNK